MFMVLVDKKGIRYGLQGMAFGLEEILLKLIWSKFFLSDSEALPTQVLHALTQPTSTSLKLTIETLEQGVKYVLESLLWTLNIFHTLF